MTGARFWKRSRKAIMQRPVFGASRRQFLSSLATTGVSTLVAAQRFFSQTKPSSTAPAVRIDVHYHIVPPSLLQAVGAQRLGSASANWNPAQALEAMDQAAVSTGISSIAPAGDPFSDRSTAVRLCRESNEY